MSVQNFRFAPASVQVQPGEKVDFKFDGPSPHTATLRAGQTDRFDSGLTGPGFTRAHRFNYPGRFALFCEVHPEMTGRVQVGAPESAKPRLTRLEARPGVGLVRLTFRLSERSVVTAAVGTRRVRKVLAPGSRSITVKSLGRGSRNARITAADGWGNRSLALRKSFSIR